MLAQLNHPSIATVHGFEESGGVHALIMELVDGDTLTERIARGPIALEDVLAIAKPIAEALEAAHEERIIHRDLKPANIKVKPDGTVKVLDFGLAKALSRDSVLQPADLSNSPTLTGDATGRGVILGTAAYMAPEQARGRAVDRRADIWSFGVILYEMLTGRQVFKGDDVSETLASVLKDAPDFGALPAETPRVLRQLIERCLTRDTKMRLRDIGEARIVLDGLIRRPHESAAAALSVTTVPPSRARGMRWLPWAIASIAVLAAAAAAFNNRPAEAPGRVVTRSRLELKDLSGFIHVSRDGSLVAYDTTGGDRGLQIALRRTDQLEGKPVPGAEDAEFPIISPNGQWIAYSRAQAQIKRLPITGGAPATICDGSLRNGGDWGEDDTIVFSGPQGLLRVAASGGTPQVLSRIDKAKGEIAHVRPQFLPGGTQVLFTVRSMAAAPQFAVVDLKNGRYRTIAPGGENGKYALSGHLTFVRDGSLFAMPFDVKRLAVLGPEVSMIEDVSTFGPPGTGDYSFSQNGLLIYSEGSGAQGTVLEWADRKGDTQTMPGQIPRRWGTGRLSPDGLRLANSILVDERTDIWAVDLQRGTPNRLTFNGGNDNPIWTPDGREIVYSNTNGGKFGLYSVAADGSAAPVLIASTERFSLPMSFTPDGKTLLYRQRAANGNNQIFVLTPGVGGAARGPRPLRGSNASDLDADVSPDGKWVAFTSDETGAAEVYVIPFPGPGGRTRVSTSGGRDARWARRGRELFFRADVAATTTRFFAATIQTIPTINVGMPIELFSKATGSTWDPAPAGDRLLIENFRSAGISTSFVTVTNWFEELRRRAPLKK